MDTSKFKLYSDLFKVIDKAVFSPEIKEKSLEEYLLKKALPGRAIMSKTVFVKAMVDLKLAYKKEMLELLADNLIDKSSSMIDLNHFFSVFRSFIRKDPDFGEPTQAIYSVPSIVRQKSLKTKALQCLRDYLESTNSNLSSKFTINDEGFRRVSPSLEFSIFFSQNKYSLTDEEKDAFLKLYQLPDNSKKLDIDAIEKDLAIRKDDLEIILEEVRLAVMATFTDIIKLII